jgi:hypothetical protein
LPAIENITGTFAEVDPALKSLRTSIRPPECLGWFSVGAQTGNMTAIATAAPIFSLRNIGTNSLIVRRVGVGLVATVGYTSAQKFDVALVVARNFTVSDSGGTTIAFAGSNAKHRTSLATLTSADCRIATTAALTSGTKTLDVNYVSQVFGWAATGAAGVVIPSSMDNLLKHDSGDYPIILGQNEGINIVSLTLGGAGGTVNALINIEITEAVSF